MIMSLKKPTLSSLPCERKKTGDREAHAPSSRCHVPAAMCTVLQHRDAFISGRRLTARRRKIDTPVYVSVYLSASTKIRRDSTNFTSGKGAKEELMRLNHENSVLFLYVYLTR